MSATRLGPNTGTVGPHGWPFWMRLLGAALLALATARCSDSGSPEHCSTTSSAPRCHEGIVQECDMSSGTWVDQDCLQVASCFLGVCGQDGRCHC